MQQCFMKVKRFIEYIRYLNKRKLSKRVDNILYKLLLNASVDEHGIYSVTVNREEPAGLYKNIKSDDTIRVLRSLSITLDEKDGVTKKCCIFSSILLMKSGEICFEFSSPFTDEYAKIKEKITSKKTTQIALRRSF